MATKIKTPLTMSQVEQLEQLAELLKGLTRDLKGLADRMEEDLGPPPRPDLSLVPSDESDD